MTLEDIRGQWEEGQEVELIVTKKIDNYSSLFVLLKSKGEQYRLHRYFPIGDNWNVSVDKQGSLQECLLKLTQAFKEVYPKV